MDGFAGLLKLDRPCRPTTQVNASRPRELIADFRGGEFVNHLKNVPLENTLSMPSDR
jgi:hypothetical protein